MFFKCVPFDLARRMKVNAWTYSVVVYFHLPTTQIFRSGFCSRKSPHNIVIFTKESCTTRMACIFISHESRTHIATTKAETAKNLTEDFDSLNLPQTRPLNAKQLSLDFLMSWRCALIIFKSGQLSKFIQPFLLLFTSDTYTWTHATV